MKKLFQNIKDWLLDTYYLFEPGELIRIVLISVTTTLITLFIIRIIETLTGK